MPQRLFDQQSFRRATTRERPSANPEAAARRVVFSGQRQLSRPAAGSFSSVGSRLQRSTSIHDQQLSLSVVSRTRSTPSPRPIIAEEIQ